MISVGEVTVAATGVDEARKVPPLGGEEDTSWTAVVAVAGANAATGVEEDGIMPPLGGDLNRPSAGVAAAAGQRQQE